MGSEHRRGAPTTLNGCRTAGISEQRQQVQWLEGEAEWILSMVQIRRVTPLILLILQVISRATQIPRVQTLGFK